MADIELVIKIPEDLWNKVNNTFPISEGYRLAKCVKNGTLLPKGHGRLIDADAFITTMEYISKRQKYKELLIDNFLTVDDVFKAVILSLRNEGLAEGDAPTIIEADTIT